MCRFRLVGRPVPLDRRAAPEESDRLASRGLRVLAMAYKPAPPGANQLDHRDVESGLILAGLQGMIDPPQPKAIDAVGRCQRTGIPSSVLLVVEIDKAIRRRVR